MIYLLAVGLVFQSGYPWNVEYVKHLYHKYL